MKISKSKGVEDVGYMEEKFQEMGREPRKILRMENFLEV